MIEVIQAIQKVKSNQASYASTTPAERARWMHQISKSILRSADELAQSEARAHKMDVGFVRLHSIEAAAKCFERAAGEIDAHLEAQEDSTFQRWSYQPTGLISVILPWTLSFRVLAERVAPALAAGNVVLVKTSSQSPQTGTIFQRVLATSGFPEGVCQIISGPGTEVGALMACHPAIRAVSFAGSFAVAEGLLKAPALMQKKLQFAKNGNNSAILIGDSWSSQQMSTLVEACFAGDGQLPWNIKKIFVPEVAQKSFVDDFVSLAKARSAPRLISDRAAKQFEQVIGQIQQEGARVVCAGNPVGIGVDLSHCSTLQQDSLEGPVVLISPVKYLHEAVKWANTGYLGLCGLILGDAEKAQRTAEKLECGQVWINRWLSADDGVVTGIKQSSFGIMDFQTFGAFYSDRKKIVGPAPK